MATVTKRSSLSRMGVALNPGGTKKQTLDSINKLVALAAGRAGCDGCGRIAYIDLHFLGDPDPDVERLGGISVDVQTR